MVSAGIELILLVLVFFMKYCESPMYFNTYECSASVCEGLKDHVSARPLSMCLCVLLIMQIIIRQLYQEVSARKKNPQPVFLSSSFCVAVCNSPYQLADPLIKPNTTSLSVGQSVKQPMKNEI